MKKMPQNKCMGTGAELLLCTVTTSLMPLYSTHGADRPDAILGEYPNASHIVEGLKVLIDVMLPGKMTAGAMDPDDLPVFMFRRLAESWRYLQPEIERAIPFRWLGEAARVQGRLPSRVDAPAASRKILQKYMRRLADVRCLLIEDVRAAYEGDPAALTFAEVQLAYPGVLAIASHRLAHELYRLDVPIVPRIMSEWTHAQTGVDIHPGARIGHGFFIDHATGVVIGETARIGNHVKLYQGVTLGARSFALDAHGHPVKHIQRHPTVEDNVVIYAHATILGGDTVIGKGSVIGGNVFLMESVPPNSFVSSKHPELHIRKSKRGGASARRSRRS